MNPTFASFLTPEGIIVAGGLVTALISVVKATFPAVSERVSGALLAFAFTGALYVATVAAVPPASADGFLTVFAAWLSCATAAIGIHSAARHVRARS